jgi:hypothetical protein
MKCFFKSGLLLCFLNLLSACTFVGAWEKGDLSRPEMTFVPDPMEQKMGDHIYFSKEGSSSGAAVSGGGCGCN